MYVSTPLYVSKLKKASFYIYINSSESADCVVPPVRKRAKRDVHARVRQLGSEPATANVKSESDGPGMEIYELESLSRAVSSKLAPDWLHKGEQPIRS